ncbi:MAG: hypothetical protein FJ109_18560 [Deltaproteobacteria bacterium]|nr:hypothetical protein [Deltaproteobacteria bacterium]
MPFELELPAVLRKAGWKVKIRDKERVEPPHVTVMRGPDMWRIGLRDVVLLQPPGGSWSEVPDGIRRIVEQALPRLREAWDAMYPENPVGGEHD